MTGCRRTRPGQETVLRPPLQRLNGHGPGWPYHARRLGERGISSGRPAVGLPVSRAAPASGLPGGRQAMTRDTKCPQGGPEYPASPLASFLRAVPAPVARAGKAERQAPPLPAIRHRAKGGDPGPRRFNCCSSVGACRYASRTQSGVIPVAWASSSRDRPSSFHADENGHAKRKSANGVIVHGVH
jgi:hypothetical protein